MGLDSRVSRSKKKRPKKKTTKKKLVNQICKFIVFQAIFIGVTSPFLFLYGPFKTLDTVAMETPASFATSLIEAAIDSPLLYYLYFNILLIIILLNAYYYKLSYI